MKKNFAILLAITAWTTVFTQYYLMIENRAASITETTIRFFSFFTILTNSLVAIYFTLAASKIKGDFPTTNDKGGNLTAITVYITIVGLVYQIILRNTWQPTGLQMIVDELLHTVIPIMVIIYWYLFENKSLTRYSQILKWLAYPLVYLTYILIRGKLSDFYPYHFVDAGNLGLSKVLMNSALLIALFAGLSVIFISVGKAIKNI
jgi:hypothetical protein